MSKFEDRLVKGNMYAQSVLERLNTIPGVYAVINGLEHTHKNFHNHLNNFKSEDDFTTIFSRYQPDGIATNISSERTIIFEVKNSTSIEKNAFVVYYKWFEIGCRLFLIIRRKDSEELFSEYCIPIEKVKLISGIESVEGYPNPFPVDSDDWISPRLLNDPNSEFYDQQKWGKYLNSKKGSGTPFRYFDFDKMGQYRFSEIKEIFEQIKLQEEVSSELSLVDIMT